METGELSDIVGDVYARAESREVALHPKSEPDEYLEVMSGQSNALGRISLFLKRDLLRDKLGRLLAPRPPVARTIASLSGPSRAAFEVQWARDPSLFVLPGLIGTLDQLAVTVTSRRLDSVKAKLEESGATTLEGLAAKDRKDEWGADFELGPGGEDSLVLISLGKDAVRGGTGAHADLQRIIHVPRKGEGDAPVASCGGKTAVTMKRTELDATLADMNAAAKGARVTPSFRDGVARGFKLTHVQPDSIFAHAGLCEGDVVNAVNGLAINTPDNALEAYTRLRKATRVELSLLRAGAPATLVVQLK
jgi:hypothetical protein